VAPDAPPIVWPLPISDSASPFGRAMGFRAPVTALVPVRSAVSVSPATRLLGQVMPLPSSCAMAAFSAACVATETERGCSITSVSLPEGLATRE